VVIIIGHMCSSTAHLAAATTWEMLSPCPSRETEAEVFCVVRRLSSDHP
jgi:hypothetical protein